MIVNIIRVKNGFKSLSKPINLAIFLILNLMMIYSIFHCKQAVTSSTIAGLTKFLYLCMIACMAVLWLLLVFVTILAFGTPIQTHKVKTCFENMGLANHAGDFPALLEYAEKDGIIRMVIYTYGIPLSKFNDEKENIESGLNITILNMQYIHGKKCVLIEAVSAFDLPDFIPWNKQNIPKEDGIIAVGVGYGGIVKLDFNKTPHALLGGSSGSGKTELVKVIAQQFADQGADVVIEDFKGGPDYGNISEKIKLITTVADLEKVLSEAISEIEIRKVLLSKEKYPNVVAYNSFHEEKPLKRKVIIIDELAEVTDTTGSSKENKKRASEIIDRLSTIARLGRAFSINLILATQRPDANIVPGQIKNNMDIRICGRADSVLSMIILDNTIANTEIPKDAQGRFVMSDGTVFQGYYL